MLKKMRRRVILAAMLAFSAVVLLIAVLVNVVNYGVVTNRADDTLSAILKFEEMSPDERVPKEPDPGAGGSEEGEPQEGEPGKPEEGAPGRPPERPFMGLPDVEANYMTRFFTVRFDSAGEVVFASTDYIAAIGEEDAVAYARQVLKEGSARGYMKAYRYVREAIGDETVVVFLNTSRDQQSMLSLLVLTVFVSCVSLLIVFVLVELLAGRAIRPYANNIRQQKQFITDASHELKTPLTSISTSLDVLTMEHGEDEWTENIRKQTGRMSKLVSELVTLSKLDEESPVPDKEEFSLSNAAWEIVDVYMPQAKAQGKNFSVDIEDDVMLFGEKASIQQMLSVLLDNAVRYCDEKGDIRFSLNRKKNRVYMEVFNTCDYETPPDTERLFDRFYRPDESRNSKTGGNGVGLSIARAVTQAHGGKISASCPSGKSMTIKISL
ncbi:MAG: HAMP domain-containing histidine kinase [Lachnospiraceae bacterium]|nr:HAMP domain-containing histidine kinase [Lachnospiraceae bacterium]